MLTFSSACERPWPNPMRLVWVLSREGACLPPARSSNEWIREGNLCCRLLGLARKSEPTVTDRIERNVVIREPISSKLATGQSMIVATQARLHSGSTYQGMRSAESAVICDYLKGKMKCQVVSERQGRSFGELSPLPFPTDK